MLHGRKSLVRLVGKRRRAFFSPLARRLRSQDDSDSGEAKPVDSKEHQPLVSGDRSCQAGVAELVSCPVCDASVRGDDFSLNSHLDACLSKGKKRKLNQRTLLQVNFLSKPREETCLVEADNINVDKCEKDISEESQFSNFDRSDVLMLYGNDERCESPKTMNPSLYSSEFGSGTSMLKIMDEDGVNGQAVDPHFPSGFCQDNKEVSTLETFIVGRRFHEKVDLQHGVRVYTMREPKNPKDDNAIKVFFEDQGCRYPLGYLPRELAKYISPLIDNRKLECENGVRHVRKQELIEYILSASRSRSCVLQKMVFEHVGTCVKITSTVEAILWRIQRLFFLNGEQDLSAFLLVDIGLIKFPEYTCIISKPIFSCRSDLLGYEEAIEVAQIMDESIDESNMEMTIRCVGLSSDSMVANFSKEIQSSFPGTQPDFFSYFSAWWVYSKVVSLGVSVYEREHRYHDAIRLLRGLLNRIMYDSRCGYWTLRLSIDLEHLGHFNESLSIAERGLDDPWIRAGSKMALQRRVLRLGKPPRRWKIPSYAETVMRKIKEISIRGRPLKNEIGAKSLFYGTDNELCGVEKLALQYYAEEGGGWQGIHSESGIWMTIFGLLMWSVIFSDVPNVFRSKFQVAPLDLLTDDFYVVRKMAIESQLEKIHQGMAEEILITSWQLHEGTLCHGVSWDRFSLSDLRAAVSCIGGRCLASLCRHLSADYRSWSSGMPDLLLWRFHGNDIEGGEAKLVEVKGPRDRLSEQQRAWIYTLMDCGIDTEVCNVSPSPKSQKSHNS